MSRSGYGDDGDGNPWLWMRAVQNAIKGRRGQAFLREMLEALDAMPQKRLIEGQLENEGQVCAIGAVGLKRGLQMEELEPYDDGEEVAKAFGIAPALVCEIAYQNDDCGRWEQTPEERWARMRVWVQEQLK